MSLAAGYRAAHIGTAITEEASCTQSVVDLVGITLAVFALRTRDWVLRSFGAVGTCGRGTSMEVNPCSICPKEKGLGN